MAMAGLPNQITKGMVNSALRILDREPCRREREVREFTRFILGLLTKIYREFSKRRVCINHVHPFIPTLPGHDEIIRLWAETGENDNLRLANLWRPDLSYTDGTPLF
jgi:hypothetical protein